MRFIALLALSAVAWSTAMAAGGPGALRGVWQGTVGQDAVRVCFEDAGASFYRLKDGRGIGLETQPAPYPTPPGLVFPVLVATCRHSPECVVDITIPYDSLGRHLTAEGKTVAKQFQGKSDSTAAPGAR